MEKSRLRAWFTWVCFAMDLTLIENRVDLNGTSDSPFDEEGVNHQLASDLGISYDASSWRNLGLVRSI